MDSVEVVREVVPSAGLSKFRQVCTFTLLLERWGIGKFEVKKFFGRVLPPQLLPSTDGAAGVAVSCL